MKRTYTEKFLAWCVHGYSMLGLVAGAIMGVCIVRGTPESFRTAFVLMWAATLIDATDGFLARAARVKQVLPGFDGRRLDDLIDFLNYTYLPLLLLWRADVLPEGLEPFLLIPLIASIYGFSQTDAKTDDGYFLGFPSYWNLLAFYIYSFLPLPGFSLFVILFFSILTFLPSRYIYSTQPGKLNQFTNVLAVFWSAFLFWLMMQVPATEFRAGCAVELPIGTLYYASLAFPAYYLLTSWGVSLRRRF